VVRHRSRGGTRCFIVATRVVKFISEGQFIERRGINYDAGVGQLIAFLCPAVSEHVNSVHEYFDDLFSNQVSQRKFPTML
jgi:hypothetical protein